MNPNQSPHSTPAEQAATWLASSPLFLDTETTGFHNTAEVIDIAVVDAGGRVLLNTLVRPLHPIPSEAYAIHGITDADVAHAPGFLEVHAHLHPLLAGRRVIIYNRDYDVRILLQSAAAVGLPPDTSYSAHCAMKLYADFAADWNERRQANRWHTLQRAAAACRLEWPANAHRALPDAQICRQLVQHMAKQVPEPPAEPQPTLF